MEICFGLSSAGEGVQRLSGGVWKCVEGGDKTKSVFLIIHSNNNPVCTQLYNTKNSKLVMNLIEIKRSNIGNIMSVKKFKFAQGNVT